MLGSLKSGGMLQVNQLRRLGRISKTRYNIVKYPKISAGGGCVWVYGADGGGISQEEGKDLLKN